MHMSRTVEQSKTFVLLLNISKVFVENEENSVICFNLVSENF